MGFGGFAIKVLNTNRGLLKKKRPFHELKGAYLGYGNSKLIFKELSEFEKKKIRESIIAQAKRDCIHETKIYFASFFALLLIIYGIYLFVTI